MAGVEMPLCAFKATVPTTRPKASIFMPRKCVPKPRAHPAKVGCQVQDKKTFKRTTVPKDIKPAIVPIDKFWTLPYDRTLEGVAEKLHHAEQELFDKDIEMLDTDQEMGDAEQTDQEMGDAESTDQEWSDAELEEFAADLEAAFLELEESKQG